jgi:hypothetical protein
MINPLESIDRGASMDYFVDNQAGNDTNNGSQRAPFKTIARAVQAAKAGDTLRIVPTPTPYTGTLDLQKSGAQGAPITITSAHATNNPIITPDTSWRVKADYWILERMDWTLYKDWAIQLGGSPLSGYGPDNAFARHITIRDCMFRHAPFEGVQIAHADDVRIEGCLFRDIRKRVKGQDCCALNIYGGSNITVIDCEFEDIGSDGVHIGPKHHQIGPVTIQDCKFRTNRPYGSVSWQNWGQSVGENAIDIKGLWASSADPDLIGPVIVRGCTMTGFNAIYPGQDCSDGGEITRPYPGGGLVIHMDAINVEVDNCVITNCDQAIALHDGKGDGGTTAGMKLTRSTIRDCAAGLSCIRALASLIATDNTFDCDQYLYAHRTPITFTSNFVKRGTYVRDSQDGLIECFDRNIWLTAHPSQWTGLLDSTTPQVDTIKPATNELTTTATDLDAAAKELDQVVTAVTAQTGLLRATAAAIRTIIANV